ncbi:MAG: hypothetical protein U0325_13715 [Polyangiales bacterium]
MLSRTTNVPNLTGMVQVSAGGGHACAVHATGTVRCFGNNSVGQLGGSSTTTDVPGLTGVTQVAAGLSHTCALLAGGTVRCWGLGAPPGSSPTTDVPGLTDVVELSVETSTALEQQKNLCARRRDGSIRCWGDNSANQLGVPSGQETGTPVTPVCVPGCARSAPATPTTCGLTCVDTQTNNAHCGACGTRCTDGRTCRAGTCQAPAMCPTGQTACGTPAICVNTQTDARHCGRCDNALPAGQVCVGGVGVTGGATQLAAGEYHTCAITAGTVRCWGSDLLGERGDGEGTSGEVCSGPSEVPGMPPVPAVELTAGAYHTCARLMDNTVRCWGGNDTGQLGDGSPTSRTSPVAVTGLTNAVEIAAGYSHTCARLMDNTVRCWGANGSGQIGDDSTTNRRSPVAVMGLTNVAQIAAGSAHTCARLMDNTVRCWGDNVSSQLGDGSTTRRLTPVAVMGLTDVVEIAAGGAYTCARRMDNTVRCWGANARGQLGDGSTDPRTSPVAVMGLTDAAEIALGRFHTCARSRDNTVRCWGDNSLGQLGDRSLMFRLTPVAVACFSTPAPTTTCMAGQTSCGTPAMCVDTQTSSAHCGACDTACAMGSTCVAGVCELTCAAPTTRCGAGDSATCENLQTSNAHCGACDTPCTDGRTCTNGMCQAPTMCPTGQTACGTPVSCVNTQTDARHCGRCDNALPAGQFCVGGVGVTGGASQLAAGEHHTCAISAGTVRCWGSDAYGQRGDGDGISGEVCSGPSEIPGMPPVPAVEVAAGNTHTCARLMDGTVRCWGSNGGGKHIAAHRAGRGHGAHQRRADRRGPGPHLRALDGRQSCAVEQPHRPARRRRHELTAPRRSRSWGLRTWRRSPGSAAHLRTPGRQHRALLGLGTNTASSETAARNLALHRSRAGAHERGGDRRGRAVHLRALDGQHRALLGIEQRRPSRRRQHDRPHRAGRGRGLTNVVQLVAGAYHTCARRMDNTVRCWGQHRRCRSETEQRRTAPPPWTYQGSRTWWRSPRARPATCARLMDNRALLGMEQHSPARRWQHHAPQLSVAVALRPPRRRRLDDHLRHARDVREHPDQRRAPRRLRHGRALANVAMNTCAAGACGVGTCATAG